jgi:hypothetical protein
MAVLRHKRCRRHQYRKSWQWQSALGQQDVEENDQEAILVDDGSDVLHLSVPANAPYQHLYAIAGFRNGEDLATRAAPLIEWKRVPALPHNGLCYRRSPISAVKWPRASLCRAASC